MASYTETLSRIEAAQTLETLAGDFDVSPVELEEFVFDFGLSFSVLGPETVSTKTVLSAAISAFDEDEVTIDSQDEKFLFLFEHVERRISFSTAVAVARTAARLGNGFCLFTVADVFPKVLADSEVQFMAGFRNINLRTNIGSSWRRGRIAALQRGLMRTAFV